jgi:hypothetical protein
LLSYPRREQLFLPQSEFRTEVAESSLPDKAVAPQSDEAEVTVFARSYAKRFDQHIQKTLLAVVLEFVFFLGLTEHLGEYSSIFSICQRHGY